MPTIVEYTDTLPAQNRFPEHIVSPSRSGSCCFISMEALGEPQADGRWIYQYKRCKQCGFTVRVILEVLPDQNAIAMLREKLAALSAKPNGF